ncbi:MAG: transcription termination factor NusA [Anaerovoracaceae bacterium]|jgi:N utilization substance protein A|nr:transcription termination factor NusA [Anaerovoracaceae bacterium]
MNKEFIEALEALEEEKEISKEVLIEAIESALVAAYKKNYGTSQNVEVNINQDTGDIDILHLMGVVDEVDDDMVEISIDDAKEIDSRYEIGDTVSYQVTHLDFGRIAAQTAKQVVVQRIREAERGMVFDDFINRQGEVITGTVQRISNETVFFNMGKAEGILSVTEQVPGETYTINSRIKVYIMDVKKTNKGPQVYLSRSHPGLVKSLFELEVPEIQDGIVEIKGISREAGSRTKIAVWAEDGNVDPVGACVGARGVRVQSVVDELFGEKIDVITWSDDPQTFIANVLSPAKVDSVILGEEGKSATVIVPDYQLSLAIGKEGQNVRLAAKLCGWKIDIKSHSQYYGEDSQMGQEEEYDGEQFFEDVVEKDEPEKQISEENYFETPEEDGLGEG